MTAVRAEARSAPSEDAPLAVHELCVSYGGVKAVDGVTFDVPRGSIVGLIGPNGAGKTSVFDAISGLAPIERGTVRLEGRDVTKLAAAGRARAGLGRSFQDGKLFPSLTVEETLACAFERHLGVQDPVSTAFSLPWIRSAERRISKRVDELIDLMGLEAFRDKFVSELSTGSRRIVDLACVLAHEPSVLLLDEPSSGIAQKETEALGPLLLRVKKATGCTMLMIEHDMPLITSVSDELIALETGRVIARGTPKEVTNDARVVEAYLGTDESLIARSGKARTKRSSKGRRSTSAGGEKRPTRRKRSARSKSSKETSPSKRSKTKKTSTSKSASKAPKRPASKKKAGSTSSKGSSGSSKSASPKRSAPEAPAKKKSSSTKSGSKGSSTKGSSEGSSSKRKGSSKGSSGKKTSSKSSSSKKGSSKRS